MVAELYQIIGESRKSYKRQYSLRVQHHLLVGHVVQKNVLMSTIGSSFNGRKMFGAKTIARFVAPILFSFSNLAT